MKGSFKDSCWLPHCLGDEMLLSLLPRKHRWEGFLATSTLVNRGLFPELHALLFQMEKFSLHNHYQQISHKVFRHLSLTLTPYDEARSVCQRENIMSFSLLTAKNNFKGSLFLISCFGFHLAMLRSP